VDTEQKIRIIDARSTGGKMPFKQQKKAAGYVPVEHAGLLRLKLREAGYEEHTGPSVSRHGEVGTFRKTYRSGGGLRQNHVQVVGRGRKLAMYAHTEPHTDRPIDHAFSALFDAASFSGGSRMLRNDLEASGYELRSFAEAKPSPRRTRRR
jgi:hypothetical protein